MVGVSQLDASAFASWLTEREREANRLTNALTYRLPTVEEWAAFARCGTNRKFPWGDEWPPKYGNCFDETCGGKDALEGYRDGHVSTCAVTDTVANEWGINGMAGNVSEWVVDENHPDRSYSTSGCYAVSWAGCFVIRTKATGNGYASSASDKNHGFRLVLAPAREAK